MLRLLSTTLVLGSLVYANTTTKLEDFLVDEFEDNPKLKSVEAEVVDVVPLDDFKDWKAYIVDVDATLKKDSKHIQQKMIWFSNGQYITKDLINMESGVNLTEKVKPSFQKKFYTKENLIYGDVNAKHKVVIFSDPLCPFCKMFVPKAIKEMKKEPKKFAIYYYHFPLERLHPAASTIVKAAVVAEMKGIQDVVLKMYDVKINYREKDTQKILNAFNKAFKTNITIDDINSKKVKEKVEFDQKVAIDMMVAGTPTVYFDGKLDKSKKKYKTAK